MTILLPNVKGERCRFDRSRITALIIKTRSLIMNILTSMKIHRKVAPLEVSVPSLVCPLSRILTFQSIVVSREDPILVKTEFLYLIPDNSQGRHQLLIPSSRFQISRRPRSCLSGRKLIESLPPAPPKRQLRDYSESFKVGIWMRLSTLELT